MAVNLKSMSRKELLKLREDVEKELKLVDERERQEALKAVQQAAAKFGFSLDDLAGGGRKRRGGKARRAKAGPKYRNPADPDQTWSGLGRKPQWFHDEVAKGTDISTLEI